MKVYDESEVDDATATGPTLTKRELQILRLIGEGHSSKQVATQLFVSKRTVDFHLANIYEKLEVGNRMQAMQRAQRLGLLTLQSEEEQP